MVPKAAADTSTRRAPEEDRLRVTVGNASGWATQAPEEVAGRMFWLTRNTLSGS